MIPAHLFAAAVARAHICGRALQAFTAPLQGLPELGYPFHDCTITVTRCGGVAGPAAVLLSGRKRCADGMYARRELALIA